MTIQQGICELGMVGLGVMGRNILLNMADHGYQLAGFDTDSTKVDSLNQEGKESHALHGAKNIQDFINLLKKPRAIMMLLPAGPVVDAVIKELTPYLESGDLLIDAGNSHFIDTNRREKELKDQKFQFIGMGVSGGEEGARRGPSMMPGGTKKAYERVRVLLEAISAHVNQVPCVTYIGESSSGHYVKMVHNGIEYGIMQLIAETYDLMKRGLGLNNQQIQKVYASWNEGDMNSYLLEITSKIFEKKEGHSDLIDLIVPVAAQNGTGMWTSLSAMELQVPTPTIDVAVVMRNLSVMEKQREQAHHIYSKPLSSCTTQQKEAIQHIQEALYSSMIMVYAQGMALIQEASKVYHYGLNLESIARIWRGGCIIRAKLLNDFMEIFHEKPELSNLMLDPIIAQKISPQHQNSLRHIVKQACDAGIPAPAFMASLSYFDAYRSVWSPANLIQAQRDDFGSHTYERIDQKGIFHTEWNE